jgi:hypothetical protein
MSVCSSFLISTRSLRCLRGSHSIPSRVCKAHTVLRDVYTYYYTTNRNTSLLGCIICKYMQRAALLVFEPAQHNCTGDRVCTVSMSESSGHCGHMCITCFTCKSANFN